MQKFPSEASCDIALVPDISPILFFLLRPSLFLVYIMFKPSGFCSQG